MREPRRADEHALSPVRRGRAPSRAAVEGDTDADALARGQAAAVLGALGRLQLRVELLAREQAEALAAIQSLLETLDRRVDALTLDHDQHVGGIEPAGQQLQ